MNFRVGQKVVCVDAKNHMRAGRGLNWAASDRIYEGAVYTVRRCFPDDEGILILWLCEVERCAGAKKEWGDNIGYGAFRFRPVVEHKTDISIFTKLLTPSPARSKELCGND